MYTEEELNLFDEAIAKLIQKIFECGEEKNEIKVMHFDPSDLNSLLVAEQLNLLITMGYDIKVIDTKIHYLTKIKGKYNYSLLKKDEDIRPFFDVNYGIEEVIKENNYPIDIFTKTYLEYYYVPKKVLKEAKKKVRKEYREIRNKKIKASIKNKVSLLIKKFKEADLEYYG